MICHDLTPLAPVSDMDDAIAFLTDTLGFTLSFRGEGYAHLRRDGATIRLLHSDDDLTDAARHQGYYIDVDDVDALHAHLSPVLGALPPECHQPPSDTAYGQREFVVVYEALMFVFGQPVEGS
ncbi:VOC family protein [Jannaschia pagri]|nr:VOC family protein [Jannaschia sp. AI_62]